MDRSFAHKPVLLQEVLEFLQPKPGMVFVDGTLGGGGHSKAILEKILPGGKLLAFDQDLDAINAAKQVLTPLGEENFQLFHRNFRDMAQALSQTAYEKVDGILLDLGVSSYQLDQKERGFSYQYDAPLDMRMDRTQDFDAAELVNKAGLEELARIIRDYGEEKWAKRIASFIVEERQRNPLRTTGQLVEVIKKAIPNSARREGPHPAKRTFQALRIAVNRELEILPPALEDALGLLKPGGRMAVITFHSLEDRLVKTAFRKAAQGCVCPKDFPMCVCQQKPRVKIITGKPVVPTTEEIADNPRARSAKLRVVEKV
ncbi:MAG TPA: 16S rRNA (cytosine(1402)-N(4))-methyltransferase RsmH [Clostridia bacterium]|jgi:16S rRNA (cytosine1402-N4)-methyltransferase|nr:16S rRNA (cytosine(1402)-N(4))-methyltransferase RsmH [Clostridia bacterium]HOB81809.1 16S rRNA (cytosine(1402)-N(4))-methyltransferase RsmH [Peptococcaceae bacterium]HPZ71403.1 16S rRNA (cytosine(1402)-N(4))-methyltransferase RsmH [Peptococcaceae bacterium]